jgi:hypothetical protein
MFLKNESFTIIGELLFIVILSLLFSATSLLPLKNGKEGFSPLEYTNNLTPSVASDDLFRLNSINDTGSECKKVAGFPGYGVFCNPSSKPNNIDVYSQAKGDISCDGAGYFNSRGSLCMDDNMKRMLYTRGANAVGGNGQIGSV